MTSLVLGVLAAWLLIGLAVGILVGKCIHAGTGLRENDAPAPVLTREVA